MTHAIHLTWQETTRGLKTSKREGGYCPNQPTTSNVINDKLLPWEHQQWTWQHYSLVIVFCQCLSWVQFQRRNRGISATFQDLPLISLCNGAGNGGMLASSTSPTGILPPTVLKDHQLYHQARSITITLCMCSPLMVILVHPAFSLAAWRPMPHLQKVATLQAKQSVVSSTMGTISWSPQGSPGTKHQAWTGCN